MAIQLLNPPGLPQSDLYRQVSVASGTRTVHVAAQVAQAYRNVTTALAAVDATFSDVAKITVYVVGLSPDKMVGLVDGVTTVVTELGIDPVRPITLIGVAALGEPDLLVEVEVVALLY